MSSDQYPTRNAASVNPTDLSLRPAAAGDEAFLQSLFEDARQWAFAPIAQGGQEELYQTVVKQQYEAQHSDYFNRFHAARYAIIQWSGIPIGRIYIDSRDDEVRILDIAILTAYQGKGIATIVMRGVCTDAAFRGLPVRLTVNRLNSAVRLYRALGFVDRGQPSHIQEMEWFHPEPEEILRGNFLPRSVRPNPKSRV